MIRIVELILRPLLKVSPWVFLLCYISSALMSSLGPMLWPNPGWQPIAFAVVITWVVTYLQLGWSCSVIVRPQVIGTADDVLHRKWVTISLVTFYIFVAIGGLLQYLLLANDSFTLLRQINSTIVIVTYLSATWMAARVFSSLEKSRPATVLESVTVFFKMVFIFFFVFDLKSRLNHLELRVDNNSMHA